MRFRHPKVALFMTAFGSVGIIQIPQPCHLSLGDILRHKSPPNVSGDYDDKIRILQGQHTGTGTGRANRNAPSQSQYLAIIQGHLRVPFLIRINMQIRCIISYKKNRNRNIFTGASCVPVSLKHLFLEYTLFK